MGSLEANSLRIIFAHDAYSGRSPGRKHAAKVVADLRDIAGTRLQVVEGLALGPLGWGDCDLGLVLPLARARGVLYALDCAGLTRGAERVTLLVYGLRDAAEYTPRERAVITAILDTAAELGVPYDVDLG